MKPLFTLTDTFHRDLPFTSAPSYANFYVSPDGSGIEIPKHASYVGISAIGTSGAWVKFGGSDEAIGIPVTDVEDGSSPWWVNPYDKQVTWLDDANYIYLKSSDSVVLEFWE